MILSIITKMLQLMVDNHDTYNGVVLIKVTYDLPHEIGIVFFRIKHYVMLSFEGRAFLLLILVLFSTSE